MDQIPDPNWLCNAHLTTLHWPKISWSCIYAAYEVKKDCCDAVVAFHNDRSLSFGTGCGGPGWRRTIGGQISQWRRSIETLDVPVLVLLGENDPLTPACETARAWREALSQGMSASQIRVLQGAGHGLRTGGHSGDFVSDYFPIQFDWLQTIGVLMPEAR